MSQLQVMGTNTHLLNHSIPGTMNQNLSKVNNMENLLSKNNFEATLKISLQQIKLYTLFVLKIPFCTVNWFILELRTCLPVSSNTQ